MVDIARDTDGSNWGVLLGERQTLDEQASAASAELAFRGEVSRVTDVGSGTAVLVDA